MSIEATLAGMVNRPKPTATAAGPKARRRIRAKAERAAEALRLAEAAEETPHRRTVREHMARERRIGI